MIETLKEGDLELIFDEKGNTVTFIVKNKAVLVMEFEGYMDEMFYRALTLWSKKFANGYTGP